MYFTFSVEQLFGAPGLDFPGLKIKNTKLSSLRGVGPQQELWGGGKIKATWGAAVNSAPAPADPSPSHSRAASWL